MALTKNSTADTLFSAVTVVPGTPQRSPWFAIGYDYSAHVEITNGGTGPTAAAVATLEVSADQSTVISTAYAQAAGTTASQTYPMDFNLGLNDFAAWKYGRIRVDSNTGQNVTANGNGSGVSAV